MDDSHAIVPVPNTRTVIPYQEAKDFSIVAAKSNLFLNKDISTSEKALAVIMIGREMGIGPAASLRGIFMINGVPSLSSRLMAGLIRSSGDYDYETLERTDKASTIQILRKVRGKWVALTPTTRFTIEDAKRAGLIKGGSPWEKYPRNMTWARALSDGFGIHCPHLANGMPIYSHDDAESAPEPVEKVDNSQVPDAEFEPVAAPREVLPPTPEELEQGYTTSESQAQEIRDLAQRKKSQVPAILNYHQVGDLRNLSQDAYLSVKKILEAK